MGSDLPGVGTGSDIGGTGVGKIDVGGAFKWRHWCQGDSCQWQWSQLNSHGFRSSRSSSTGADIGGTGVGGAFDGALMLVELGLLGSIPPGVRSVVLWLMVQVSLELGQPVPLN